MKSETRSIPARAHIEPLLSTLAAVGAGGLGVYEVWLRSMRGRLAAQSQVVQTPFGQLEYAEAWSGPPILVAHGILGGWDQGMLVTQLAPRGERSLHVISVSRWGYLRSPIPRNREHRSHEAQADAYASLLDQLGIDKVAMVGISGGGPSAIQFALRHPDRVWALVSIAGVTGRLDPSLTRKERMFLKVLNHDLGMLTLRTFARQWVMSLYGMTPERFAAFKSQPEKVRVLEAIYFPHPFAMRRQGFALDMERFPSIPRYPVERIEVPTLAVHGTADGTVPMSHSRFLAENVPGAQLLTIEGGGHLAIVTHKETAVTRVYQFLQKHAPK